VTYVLVMTLITTIDIALGVVVVLLGIAGYYTLIYLAAMQDARNQEDASEDEDETDYR